jgi:hypothetical protein
MLSFQFALLVTNTQGINFDDAFAPVIRMESVRSLFALAA